MPLFRRPRRLVIVATVVAAVLSTGGVALAHDNPLDGKECRAPGEAPGEIKTDYTADQPGSSTMTFRCQYGPPTLTIEFDRGLILRPIPPIGSPPPPGPSVTSGRVTADPPDTTCDSDVSSACVIEYPNGEPMVTLRAEATGPISEFDGWGGDCEFAGTNPVCILELDRSRTVVAKFGFITP